MDYGKPEELETWRKGAAYYKRGHKNFETFGCLNQTQIIRHFRTYDSAVWPLPLPWLERATVVKQAGESIKRGSGKGNSKAVNQKNTEC